jgi:hypothetical protein
MYRALDTDLWLNASEIHLEFILNSSLIHCYLLEYRDGHTEVHVSIEDFRAGQG